MRPHLLILSVFTLSACITSKPMHLPDGSLGHSITCGGQIYAFSDCFEKAGELCGAKGYDIVNANGEILPYSHSSGSIAGNKAGFAGGFQSQSGAFVNRSLFVKCKK